MSYYLVFRNCCICG